MGTTHGARATDARRERGGDRKSCAGGENARRCLHARICVLMSGGAVGSAAIGGRPGTGTVSPA